MTLRLHVLFAIARRDLASELRGRRGWVLPLIAAILLAPLASMRFPELGLPTQSAIITVSGDVPSEVEALDDHLRVTQASTLHFRQPSDGPLEVHGAVFLPSLRATLDTDGAGRPVAKTSSPPLPMPGRSLILALLASSILTGAVTESLPGERNRKTLEALLTASVSRLEIVVGKWLAWAGFGAVAALSAGLLAVLAGTMSPGWWLVALPVVPMGSVALGLTMVRRASDVVGGAAISLRVLPAVLSILGIIAWSIGLASPVLGAMVPLGGTLIAAGGTWPGPVGPLLSVGLSLVGIAGLLWWTARDLQERPRASGSLLRWSDALATAWSGAAWWLGLGAASVWISSGNPDLSAELVVWPALASATIGMFVAIAVRAAQDSEPWSTLGIKGIAPRSTLLAGPVIGLALSLVITALHPLIRMTFASPTWAFIADRMSLGAWPLASAPLLGAIVLVVQEVVFRGYLQRTYGPFGSTLLFVLIICPFDPVGGALLGGSLALLTHLARGAVGPAILARLTAAILFGLASGFLPPG